MTTLPPSLPSARRSRREPRLPVLLRPGTAGGDTLHRAHRELEIASFHAGPFTSERKFISAQ